MIKLIKEDSKYRLVNTEKIFINNKNNIIFTSKNIKFSYTDDIRMIGEFDKYHETVYLLMSRDDDNDFIPVIDMKITKNLFEFIKEKLENISKSYGNILEYEIIEDDKIVSSEELNSNIIKEKVLNVEFSKVFDKWGMRITYQDERLKRGTFTDSKIKVSSNYNIEYDRINNWLYILGKNKGKDNNIIVVSDEEKEIIEDKVKRINENYGVEKRWRAENGKGYYYITNSNFGINIDFEHNDVIDNIRYELGNYFKNKELAGSKIKEIKELLLK